MKLDQTLVARPYSEWHEDHGEVLWWRFPIKEAPWVGSPIGDDWEEGYYTHFTVIQVPWIKKD